MPIRKAPGAVAPRDEEAEDFDALDELDAPDGPAHAPAGPAADAAPRGPSKTRRKQESHALQVLGERLAGLSAHRLAAIELPDDLRDALAEAGRIRSHEGRRRHMQYIGKLMRNIDVAPIREAIARIDGESLEAAREHHLAERWRERLVAEPAALTEFADRHPRVDIQALRRSIREARRERASQESGKPIPPRHHRELFRQVRAAIEREAAARTTPTEKGIDDGDD